MSLKLWPLVRSRDLAEGTLDQQSMDVLNSIVLVILIGCVSAVILVPLLTPERLSRLVYVGFIFPTVLTARILNTHGYVKSAGIFLLGMVWLVILATSVTGGGLWSPTFAGGNMVIIAAGGLLLGWQAAVFLAGVSSLVGLFLFIDEKLNLLNLPAAIVTSASLLIGDVVFYMMIAMLFGIAIQRLKQALADAQANGLALRESEERFQAFMDTSPAIVMMKDTESRYIYCNAPFEQFFGMSREAVIGKNEFDLFPAQDAERFTASDREVLQTGTPSVMEYTAATPDGHMRDWWVFKFPVTGRGGQKYVGVQVLDISQRKQMEREREGLIQDLETRNAELERFTYTVSHDLKSPLVTIRGFLGWLDADYRAGNTAKAQADMQRIVAATEKMQRLLSELLELSRIGRIVNPPQDVAFAEIVEDAVKLTAGQIERRAVRVEIAPGLPTVRVDRARMVEVMQNLLDNATKFMGDQSQPRITISQRNNGHAQHVICVSDNGIGIERHYHERVFGLFNKLDPLAEGTGIGLALAKRIVEVHGGRIWVESDGPNTGSTFCFTLPAKE